MHRRRAARPRVAEQGQASPMAQEAAHAPMARQDVLHGEAAMFVLPVGAQTPSVGQRQRALPYVLLYSI
jgi:hypothetical protein